MITRLVLLLLTMGVGPATGQTPAVVGRVEVSFERRAAPPALGAYRARSFRPTPPAEPAAAAPVVVWLEAADAQRTTAGVDAAPVLDQQGRRFIPEVLVIRQGQTVRVLNSDPLYHNVFSLSPAKRFDVGRRRTGEAVEVRFSTAGVVDVFCDIHTHMRATVLVLPPTAVAVQQVGRDGAFAFSAVAPGTYRVGAFTPGAEPVWRAVTVPGGQTVDAGALVLGGSSG